MPEKLKAFGKKIKEEIEVYQLVRKDKRTPLLAKILLWIATGYLISPVDLIPDFIPVVGSLDDFILVPLFVIIALKMIPTEVVEECRAKVKSKNNIIRQARFNIKKIISILIILFLIAASMFLLMKYR